MITPVGRLGTHHSFVAGLKLALYPIDQIEFQKRASKADAEAAR